MPLIWCMCFCCTSFPFFIIQNFRIGFVQFFFFFFESLFIVFNHTYENQMELFISKKIIPCGFFHSILNVQQKNKINICFGSNFFLSFFLHQQQEWINKWSIERRMCVWACVCLLYFILILFINLHIERDCFETTLFSDSDSCEFSGW